MHTKLPWSKDSIGAVKNFIDIVHHDNSKGAMTRVLCRVQARPTWISESVANADLICLAVNNHQALVDALNDVVTHWTSQFERNGHLAPDWVKNARSALEKLKS